MITLENLKAFTKWVSISLFILANVYSYKEEYNKATFYMAFAIYLWI